MSQVSVVAIIGAVTTIKPVGESVVHISDERLHALWSYLALHLPKLRGSREEFRKYRRIWWRSVT